MSKELFLPEMKTVFNILNMNVKSILAAAVGVLCAVTLFAQGERPERGGRGGRRGFPEPVSDSVWVIQRTQEMVEKYNLTPEQEEAVRALNAQYAEKLNFRPAGMQDENGERPDFRSMSDAERQAFFQQMQERMGEMQERMQQMRDARKDYEKELEGILDKDQFKAYRKDRRRQEAEMQRRMQGQGGNRRPGGMGPGGPGGFRGPGGGFGGPGGGFGGGGFGGEF